MNNNQELAIGDVVYFKEDMDISKEYYIIEDISGNYIYLCGHLLFPVKPEQLSKIADNAPTVVPVRDGAHSLYCRKCHTFICNTANYEMRKEGAYAYSHICGNPDVSEIPLEAFLYN